jgi:hypothetical protein
VNWSAAAADDPHRFLRDGRLEAMPRRWRDRMAVTRYLATVALPVLLDTLPERELTDRLAAISDDPVALRRAMVDLGVVHRTRDGAEYWRTELTEYEDQVLEETMRDAAE